MNRVLKLYEHREEWFAKNLRHHMDTCIITIYGLPTQFDS